MTIAWRQFITIFNILQDHYGFSSEVWHIAHIQPWQSFVGKELWEKYEMRWAASYFAPFERLQREGRKWKWVDIKHHEQKWSSCKIILHFCMSGSVENKRWKLMQKITFVQKMLAIHENQTSNQVYAVDWLFNPTAFWTVNIFKWVQIRFYLQHRGKGYTIFGSVCPFS